MDTIETLKQELRNERREKNRLRRELMERDSIIASFKKTVAFKENLYNIAKEQKEAAVIAAEAANEAKSKFLATMSHEIRTPMNAIIGISEMELNRLDCENREAFHRIQTSGHILLDIINDILDLSKIETGKLELASAAYDTANLINDTVRLNMMRIGSKPIRFFLSVPGDFPAELIGDELRIKQILNNLLSNAIKYTDNGHVFVDFSVIKEHENIQLVITVRDTGQGMSKEQIERIFDVYSRFNTETNRHIEGVGLGMSIVKNLVGMMDGEILVESEYGIGSVFTVHLAQKSAGNAAIGKKKAEDLINFRYETGSNTKQFIYEHMPHGRVLVVDDTETNLYVAKGLMTPYGLTVETIDNGFDAISLLNSGKVYDIIFMDHMMPQIDGIETTKRIREAGYTKPIVALTANALMGQAEVFLNSGFDDFLSKPIDIRLLNTVLNKYIRQLPKAAAPQISPKLLTVFARDAEKVIQIIEPVCKNIKSATGEDFHLYAVNVHAIKSALSYIGEDYAANLALLLENAAKEQDNAVIVANTPSFINMLRAIIAKIPIQTVDNLAADSDPDFLRTQLQLIKGHCENYDDIAVEDVLSRLRQLSWAQETNALFDKIEAYILHSDFEAVVLEIERGF